MSSTDAYDSDHEKMPTPLVEEVAEQESIENLITEIESEDKDNENSDLPQEDDDEEDVSSKSVPEHFLQADPTVGLRAEDVLVRRKKFGFNRMSEEEESLVMKFCMFFVGPIQFVMEAAAILAAGLEDWIDFGIIIGLLVLNAVIGFTQEFQAGSIVDELKKTLASTANVLRDGTLQEISASEVVPGDILQLEEGTVISADGRIITKDAFLQVDQSSMTGESLPAEKRCGDECFSSSTVKRGSAFIVVTAVGDNTRVGSSARLVALADASPGHFTQVLNGIGAALLSIVTATMIAVWTAAFYRSKSIVDILRYTLAITIVGVPVGLPAVVTTTMAVGASFLARKQAIVQRLSAIESLAGVEVLCSDKTGTLTRNRLSLHEPYTVEGVDADDLMLTACLAASRSVKGMDHIDKVFIKSLRLYPRAKEQIDGFTMLEFTPFDPVSKKVVSRVRAPNGEHITCIKGSPLFVLNAVREKQELAQEVVDEYEKKVAEFASRGFRSLGVARKREEGEWEILGIMPCMDPPRHDTARTVQEALNLGLRVKMLTGDAVGIAKETCRQLNLGDKIYDADRLGIGSGAGDMNGSAVYDFVEGADGFAEVFPQHKYDVVDILQQRGYLVAMTGDGVNDAPSLKKADTGIAVEGASPAARSAADIVFLAPGLSAIIDAIKTSRQIFHRMHSYIVYRIALSVHLLLFLGLSMMILDWSLNINLLVFVAIFADMATIAIAYDHAPYSQTPIKWNLPKLWGMSIALGVVLSIGSWIVHTTTFPKDGGIVENYGDQHGIQFLHIVLAQNWLIFITRSNGPFWSSRPSRQLVGAVAAVDITATLMCIFGAFVGRTHIVTVVRVWIFSIGIFCVCAALFYLMQGSESFDRAMNRKVLKAKKPSKVIEDLLIDMKRVSTQHEKTV